MNEDILSYIKLLSDNQKIQELLIQTIGKILSNKNINSFFIQENSDKIIHIRDWISSIVENNEEWKTPRVFTIEALNNAADKYFEKRNNKIQTIELNEEHEKLVSDLGEYYVVQMLTPQSLDNESKNMQHCIGHGGYDKKVYNLGDYQFLSLRDKYNKAHATIEIHKDVVLQLQGKQNKVPDKKYLDILLPWLIDKKYKINLINYDLCLNLFDNKIYSIYDLPENCYINDGFFLLDYRKEQITKNLIINGNLYLFRCNSLYTISDSLIVNGDLHLKNCRNIKKLPKNSIVKGNLILDDMNIRRFPKNIKFYKDLQIVSSKIQELPDNLIVNGSLNLSRSDIKKLPKGLIVKGDLLLGDTYISELPIDIQFEKSVYLSRTNIVKLSDNLVFNGDLKLDGCKKIKTLPDNLVVHGNLDMQFSDIEKLPDNLTVYGNLNLSNCDQIKIFPKNLHVGGSLDLFGTKIVSFPETLSVGCNLHLDKLKVIPKKLKCKSLYVNTEQMNLITEDMEFEIVNLSDSLLKFSRKSFFKMLKDIQEQEKNKISYAEGVDKNFQK